MRGILNKRQNTEGTKMSLFDTAGATHVGKVRHNNEDSYIICNGSFLLSAVADGIGGHAHGEVASMLSCTGLAEKFKSCKFEEIPSAEEFKNIFSGWVKEINLKIFERNKAEKNPLPMGSTLCAAIFTEKYTVCANAGDSRLYCLENGRLRQLTNDHTVRHNGNNFLCRAMGVTPDMAPEMFVFEPTLADRYILVSDGVYNSLPEKDIAEILSNAADARSAADGIIERANANGGVDNLTVIAVIKR